MYIATTNTEQKNHRIYCFRVPAQFPVLTVPYLNVYFIFKIKYLCIEPAAIRSEPRTIHINVYEYDLLVFRIR
jgi:hypothetical protein